LKAVTLIDKKMTVENGALAGAGTAASRAKTMADRILSAHNFSDTPGKLKIKFDALASHDITYVGIIQSARASGIERFPVPYVLTCCHNSLCAVGGTINADDHAFGLSAAKKYGGVFVPPHIAVIHQYMREMMAGVGKMILGSDSHTRYGALGTLGVGEGGPELVKQLVGKTYDIDEPGIVAVYLTGAPRPGVGPQDVALAIIGAVFENGFVKNKVMEFFGPGVSKLSMDFRLGVDVMTTETTCLTSIWQTDGKVREYLLAHGRGGDYRELAPEDGALYDGAIEVALDKIEPMIALPFHPSNVYEISEFLRAPGDILRSVEKSAEELGMKGLKLTDKVNNGKFYVDQGVIAGCAGGLFDNIVEAAALMEGYDTGAEGFTLDVYPSSQPIYLELIKNGTAAKLMRAGAAFKTAFCGPCFGAGDVPKNGGLSIRHTTRNFPNREGSKPGEGQSAAVALMDARSIAATAANGGALIPATERAVKKVRVSFFFDRSPYDTRVYNGLGSPKPETALEYGPNITDWPKMPALTEDLLLKLASVIRDSVTTTDELIPSGETSSFRSNPVRLAEFTLSRKDPGYVARAKAAAAEAPEDTLSKYGVSSNDVMVKSAIFAVKPGDGSAREQAASCQRVLGGGANIAVEYATKRYRSNLINWGMLPLRLADPGDADKLETGDYVYLPGIAEKVRSGKREIEGYLLKSGEKTALPLILDYLTPAEREIVLRGSLINYYAAQNA
jgi:aconitate hydratase